MLINNNDGSVTRLAHELRIKMLRLKVVWPGLHPSYLLLHPPLCLRLKCITGQALEPTYIFNSNENNSLSLFHT